MRFQLNCSFDAVASCFGRPISVLNLSRLHANFRYVSIAPTFSVITFIHDVNIGTLVCNVNPPTVCRKNTVIL